MLLITLTSLLPLNAYEIYKTNIYPGAVNQQNSAYSYGLFSINTMESSSREIIITRTLVFNNSKTTYEYTYDNEGRLSTYKESLRLEGGEIKSQGIYSYEYKNGELSSVKLDEEEIFFPTPYFISIRKGGDELLFDLERDSDDKIQSITLNDQNGTKYFFTEGRLRSVESIGTSDSDFSILYSYNEDSTLKQYRREVFEGRGLSEKKTTYSFVYKEGLIDDFFYEATGKGQQFQRIHCIFEHITNADGTVEMSFALDDEGDTLRTARYEYESSAKYTMSVFDERNRLLETIEVEKR